MEEAEPSVADIRNLYSRPSRVRGSDSLITSTPCTSRRPGTVLADLPGRQAFFSESLLGVIQYPKKNRVVIIYRNGDGQTTLLDIRNTTVGVDLHVNTLSAYDIRRLMRRPPGYDPGAEVRAFMSRPTVTDKAFTALLYANPRDPSTAMTFVAERRNTKLTISGVYEVARSQYTGALRVRFTNNQGLHTEQLLIGDYEKTIFSHDGKPLPVDL